MQRKTNRAGDLEGGYTAQQLTIQPGNPLKSSIFLVVLVLITGGALFSARDQVWKVFEGASAFIHGKQNPPVIFTDCLYIPTAWTMQTDGHSLVEDDAATEIKTTAPPRIITEVKLPDNTTLQILDEPIPDDCHPENHADYGGPSVRWGLGNKARSAAECCRQCKEFNKDSKEGSPCNIWVWCGDPSGVCWTRDIHTHTTGDCWLKYQQSWDNVTDLEKTNLEVNHRHKFSDEFRKEHKTAPELIPWVAGLIAPSK